MRIIAILILLCTFSKVASAQTTEQCQPTPRAGDLLGCYNRTAPPPALGKPGTPKVPATLDKPATSKVPTALGEPTPTDEQGKVIDILAVENSKLDAKMKAICRGC